MLSSLRAHLSPKANWVFALTLLAGLCTSVLLYNTMVNTEQARLDELLHEQAQRVATNFDAAIHRRLVQVGSVAHFFASSGWVEMSEFERFVNMVYAHDTPEDRVVTWLIRSTPDTADELIAQMRQNDDPLYREFAIFDFDYTPHEPIPLNPNQPDLLVIGYTFPPRNQPHFIGRNIGKSRTVYHYAQLALQRERAYVSTIAEAIPAINDWHFFIVYPVTQRMSDGHETITGFIVSGNKLVSVFYDLKSLARSDLFHYQLTDDNHNVYSYPSNDLTIEAPHFNAIYRHRFELSGSPFELALEPVAPKFAQDNPLFIVLGLSTALVSLLVAFIIRSTLVKSQALEQQVQAQTARLASQNQALEKAVAKAEQAAKAKSEFLATMSHEIRTPMNAIIGMANLLKRSSLDERQQHLISRVSVSASHLMSIINDILDFSKMDAGVLSFEERDFALSEIAEQIIATFKSQCDENNIALNVTMAQSCPAVVRGDPLRVSQVLLNLSANAVKFTEQGGVSISLSTYPSETPGRIQLIARIKDSGIGINPLQIPKLFDAFSQADNSTTRRFGGTGLGLSISRKLCQQMNGDITAASTPGCGSEFIATMELATAQTAKPIVLDGSTNQQAAQPDIEQPITEKAAEQATGEAPPPKPTTL